jgi:cytidine diphosphoramidate kinase
MVIWLIGLSGAGKTTLAKNLYINIKKSKSNVVLLDGDNVRDTFGNDLGYSLEDRRLNADRISKMCKFLDDQGIHVICAILSLFPESRDWNRNNIDNYYEVYIEASMDDLINRDSKGLYKKAISGQIDNVAGIDLEFHPPKNADLVIKNNSNKENLLCYTKELINLFK